MATLAEVLRQAGYVTPQGQVTGPRTDLAQKLKSYVMNIPQNAAQNLANQRADIDAALTMGQGGIQIGDREAFARQMAEVPNLMGAIAYHGTPHTIKGKFDISKVGTGEGAQAYGHGMYFAENPAVAGQYAKELGTRVDVNGKPLMQQGKIVGSTGNAELDDFLVANLGDVKAARKDLLQSIKEVRPTNPEAAKDYQRLLADLRKSQVSAQSTGNLYKVDIPDEYIPNMLDWDKPINQQTAKVQEIARQLDPNLLADTPHLIVRGQPRHWTEVVDKIEDLQNPKVIKLLKKIYGESAEVMPYGDYLASKMTGQELYRNLSNPTQWSKEAAPYAMKAGMEDAAVSAKLNELGVKGIRYKDAMSRGADEGTSNFVVFDPSNVKILEQNSKPMTRKEIIEQELEKVAK